jgi:hypothetical protein
MAAVAEHETDAIVELAATSLLRLTAFTCSF